MKRVLIGFLIILLVCLTGCITSKYFLLAGVVKEIEEYEGISYVTIETTTSETPLVEIGYFTKVKLFSKKENELLVKGDFIYLRCKPRRNWIYYCHLYGVIIKPGE